MKKTKIISIVNLKGGVGKTTILLTLAYMLFKQNKRTLLIDFDPQQSLTGGLLRGYDNLEEIIEEKNIFNLLGDTKKTLANIFEPLIYLHIIPGSLKLIKFRGMGQSSLKNALKEIKKLNRYDYVLIDSPGSYSPFLENAVVASDMIICPLELNSFSLMGTQVMLEEIENSIGEEFIDKFCFLASKVKEVNDKITKKEQDALYECVSILGWEHFFEVSLPFSVAQQNFIDRGISFIGKQDKSCRTLEKNYLNLIKEIEKKYKEKMEQKK